MLREEFIKICAGHLLIFLRKAGGSGEKEQYGKRANEFHQIEGGGYIRNLTTILQNVKIVFIVKP